MKEISIEELIKAATDKKVVGDGSILDTLKEANKIAAEADKILGTMEKYRLLDPIRLYFIKKNELDKVRDIPSSNNGVVPASEAHRVAFIELNNIPEKVLKEQIEKQKQKAVHGDKELKTE